MRYDGRWIVPGQPKGLPLTDRTVTGWWQTRYQPDSLFAVVHRLNLEETDLINGDHYTSSFLTGDTCSSKSRSPDSGCGRCLARPPALSP
ncbi:hypothetical protein [Streptomyces chryseus]